MRYDLLEEKWLPCLVDGELRRMGMTEALREAHRVRELRDQFPLATFALYRFLFAVVHWLDPVEALDDWRRRWQAGKFPEDLLHLLATHGHDRFDLFHKTRPFYQHPAAATTNRPKPMPVSYLRLDFPTKTGIDHFRHVYDRDFAGSAGFCPGCCATGLITLSPFAPQGGRGKHQSLNGPGVLYFLPVGRNLFETVMLNVPAPADQPLYDPPAWERAVSPGPVNGNQPIGFLQGLTWQPRRALLLPVPSQAQACSCCGDKADFVVHQVLLPPGGDRRDVKNNLPPWTDPHVPTMRGRPLSVSDRPGHWGLALQALLPRDGAQAVQPPPTMDRLRAFIGSGSVQASSVRVDDFALRVKQAAPLWHLYRRYSLPLSLFTDAHLLSTARKSLDYAEQVSKVLALEMLDPEAKNTNNARLRNGAINRAKHSPVYRAYEAEAEQVFREALSKLAAETAASFERDTAEAIRQCAFRAFAKTHSLRVLRDRWLSEQRQEEFGNKLKSL